MIISFKDYLNEEVNDDWEIVDDRNKNISKIRFNSSDINKHKKYQQKLRQNKPENKSDKLQNEIKKRKKHMLPYTHDVDQKEMDHIEITNPALYAALTSWN